MGRTLLILAIVAFCQLCSVLPTIRENADDGLAPPRISNVLTDQRHLQREKERAYAKYLDDQKRSWTQCRSNPLPSPAGHVALASEGVSLPAAVVSAPRNGEDAGRLRRSSASLSSGNHALHLIAHTGVLQEHIGEQHEDGPVPRKHFSVEVWVKPEGGQPNPAVIIEAEDTCSPFAGKGWSLGIATKYGEESNARFYFRLQNSRSRTSTTIYTPIPHEILQWNHLVATYDGNEMRLFINGAQVSNSKEQKGDAFSKGSSDACRILRLGGQSDTHFRGLVENLRLWDIALDQRRVIANMIPAKEANGLASSLPVPTFEDSFESLLNWEWTKGTDAPSYLSYYPKLVDSPVPHRSRAIRPLPPACGYTVCDAAEIIQSYAANWELRVPKTVRYRVVNVHHSDGSKPTVSEAQIRSQHEYLQKAFQPYNITWDMTIARVFNTSLRKRTVIFGCHLEHVGNGECNPECQFPVTGYDGGDCDEVLTTCRQEMIGNGRCERRCNKAYHNWDGGDCCDPNVVADTANSCFDPTSPERAYMGVEEYKSILQFNNSHHVNVIFAQWTNQVLLGASTFPWEKDVYSVQGGVIVRADEFGKPNRMDTLVHELGHALGLWHVHRGIAEESCNSLCFEETASMETGDLCQDTNPTPMNENCSDPEPERDVCGYKGFKDTPFRNFMGYGHEPCVNHFTKQQVARMHCYLDLSYHNKWVIPSGTPPAPPLAPVVVDAMGTQLTFTWIPPVEEASYHEETNCDVCTSGRALVQYASWAESSNGSSTEENAWQPKEATGPPDAEACSSNVKAWLPNCEEGDSCFLDMGFLVNVIPRRLSLWVSWNAEHSIKGIELHFDDGTTGHLGPMGGQCDAPITLPLMYDKMLRMIRIFPNGSFVSIDAVKVESLPNHPLCASCKPLRYRIHREPAFPSGDYMDTDDIQFTDRFVTPGRSYSYRIQVWLGSRFSSLSPPLVFRHGDHFCGDGKLTGGEECDDGNIVNGDGCSAKCQTERFFYCRGEPSMCYWHDGDGICEDHEKTSSIRDCNYFTPSGFLDQWAVSATTDPRYYSRHSCPVGMLIGPPDSYPQFCGSKMTNPSASSWSPCKAPEGSSLWFTVSFSKPVVATSVFVHLTWDGILLSTDQANLAKVELGDTEGHVHAVGELSLTCRKNPLELKILHDLTQPFFLTKNVTIRFYSLDIGFSAIRLRSSQYLNPVALSQCTFGQLYSPSLQRCVEYSCMKPTCDPLVTKNAQTNCTGMEEGDVCMVSCDEGYLGTIDGNFVLTCIGGKWVGDDVHCKPIDCRPPVIPHADAFCPDGTTLGKTCTFKCRPPARIKGVSNTVMCHADGEWSEPEAQCNVMCPSPSALSNAVLISAKCKMRETFPFGHRCRFRCKAGYHVQHQANRRQVFHLRCDSKGTWTGPVCVPVSCPPPHLMYREMYNCTNEFRASSVCTLWCPGSNEPAARIRCALDGLWDSSFERRCPALSDEKCPEPVTQHEDVAFHCFNSSVGTTCPVSCILPNQEPVDTNGNTALRNITCTGKGTWYPPLRYIICRDICSTEYKGDGFCDGINNHEWCDWDGGDCCPSTLGAGQAVKPMPPDCGEKCACLDPNADENSVRSQSAKSSRVTPKRKLRPRRH